MDAVSHDDLNGPAPAIARGPHGRVLAWLALVLLLPLTLWQAALWSERVALRTIRADGAARLALYVSNLASELDRYTYLPRILAEDEAVKAVLRTPQDPINVEVANSYLERINAYAGASATYVMARDGTTLAASNWKDARSFVGKNFKFRPYFQEAMQGDLGRYFALGTTSNRPGYYLARPVYWETDMGREIIGVLVVKVSMKGLERTWAEGRTRVMVSDANGVVFITSEPDWRFRTLEPLGPETRQAIRDSRQYHTAGLRPLALTAGRELRDGDRMVTLGSGRERRVYMEQTAPVPGTDWTVHALSPGSAIDRTVYSAIALAGLGFAIVFLGVLYLVQRRHRLQDRLAYQQAVAGTLAQARDELEQRVNERTRDLSEANRRLEAEIEERRRTEQELRTTQQELVQAGKLAVLGQLSTGINHELNQPLGAVRSYADNARAFLERGRTDEARQNLADIAQLSERMAAIVRRLKGFARKGGEGVRTVPLVPSVRNALTLLEPQLTKAGVRLVDELADREIPVRGGAVRLEQVFVNLLTNALDAMQDADDKEIRLSLAEGPDWVEVRVADSGPGLPDGDPEQLFEPFYTTKEVGEGLGIGLSISYGLVRDFGGRLSAANDPQGGAVFTVRLQKGDTAG